MCGIFCILCPNKDNHTTEELLRKYKIVETQILRRGPDHHSVRPVSIHNHHFVFAASVLWLQGNGITTQPIETDDSVFVYNGDIFGGSLLWDFSRNALGDTSLLLKSLEASDDIRMTLSRIHGPYSFIYLNKQTMKLYFCRDIYGRRSLLIGRHESTLLLTSVANKKMNFNCIELPAIGIFCYDLNSQNLEILTWNYVHSNFVAKVKQLEDLLGKTIFINKLSKSVDHFKTFVAPTDQDLVYFKLLTNTKDAHAVFNVLLQDEHFTNNVKRLWNLLEIAVQKRIATQPQFCHVCIKNHLPCNHALSGVLFSGGVDCAVLALLTDKFTSQDRPIDLLNVAFNHNAPDRVTGLETLNELKQLRPHRVWNFISIDVDEEELTTERGKYIADLIYPLNTILDDSLGCALWFASRGENEITKSSCRILLVGMGADELFGGYTKHRTALKHGGWHALYQSLENDWQNIADRNLARDDRVVSDHGRQLRTPYLDEDIVQFVRSLNCWERTNPSENLPQGLGEKILLRSLAYTLGLVNTAILKKRALQFGSRIANRKENANHVSPRL